MRRAVRQTLAAALTAAALWAAGPGAVADEVPALSGIRHRPTETGLRLILDVTPAPVFTLFTLAAPDRLVIDFPALDWRAGAFATAGTPYLGEIRYGLFRRDRARVVVDLNEPLAVERAFTQPPRGAEPGRLVIDLAPVERAAFDARAGWPEQARWQGEPPPRPQGTAPGDIVVAIDPGHGGIDPGAQSEGLTEKELVLTFAEELRAEIDARPGMVAYLTRETDEFVPLDERVARARRAGAHAIVSVHADSVQEGRASGVSVYTLSEKGTDDAAEALAARENRSDVLAGADLGGESDELTRLLIELAQRGTRDESAKLARALLTAMGRQFELLRSRPFRQASFRVLKAPDIPSVLLELGFLDSPRDRKRLTDPAWRARAARATADGLADWRRQASPGFVAPR